MAFRAFDTEVGTRHEVGVRINCDKHGCDYHHAEHGQIQRVFDPVRDNETITHVLSGGEYTINGHATDIVERTVLLPYWSMVDPSGVEDDDPDDCFARSEVLTDQMDVDLHLYDYGQARSAVQWILRHFNLSPKGE